MLREKVGALETENMRLIHKLKELLGAKGDIRRAINLINDHCKQNNCAVSINKNNLIKEIKYNNTLEYPDYLKDEQDKMKNLNINIKTKIPENISLDDTYDLVKQNTKNVNSNASVSWEIEPTFEELSKMSPKELLSLSAQEKLKNDSQFEDMFKDFFGEELKEKILTKVKIRKLVEENKGLKQKLKQKNVKKPGKKKRK